LNKFVTDPKIMPNPRYQYMGVLREPIRKSYGPQQFGLQSKSTEERKKGIEA